MRMSFTRLAICCGYTVTMLSLFTRCRSVCDSGCVWGCNYLQAVSVYGATIAERHCVLYSSPLLRLLHHVPENDHHSSGRWSVRQSDHSLDTALLYLSVSIWQASCCSTWCTWSLSYSAATSAKSSNLLLNRRPARNPLQVGVVSPFRWSRESCQATPVIDFIATPVGEDPDLPTTFSKHLADGAYVTVLVGSTCILNAKVNDSL